MASASPRNVITLYFDVVSPWSRIKYEVLRRYRTVWNFDLDLRPMNLGYVMKYAENRPPISVANKGLWMNQDMERAEKFFGLTLTRPANFPINTSHAQSLLRLVKRERSNEELERAISIFFEAVWTNDLDVTKPDVLHSLAVKAGVMKGDEAGLKSLIERAMSKSERNALAQETKELVEQGNAFGAPWTVVKRKSDGQTENFFGSDRMEMIAAFLHEPYLGPFANQSVPKL